MHVSSYAAVAAVGGAGVLLGVAVGYAVWHTNSPARAQSVTDTDAIGRLEGAKDLLATYPGDHWCRRKVDSSDAAFVAVLEVVDDVEHVHQALVLMGRSCAGYQLVVALTDRDDQMKMFNRVPSQRQYESVMLAAAQVSAAILAAGAFPQMELLGNNSHELGAREGVMLLGRTEEPFCVHVHIISRGDPAFPYLGGVPLRCAPPFAVMVPRERHLAWGTGEQEAVARDLATRLEKVPLHPSVRISERKT